VLTIKLGLLHTVVAAIGENIISLLTDIDNFDMNYKMYEFEDDLIFLRDVDAAPILMKEADLLKRG